MLHFPKIWEVLGPPEYHSTSVANKGHLQTVKSWNGQQSLQRSMGASGARWSQRSSPNVLGGLWRRPKERRTPNFFLSFWPVSGLQVPGIWL